MLLHNRSVWCPPNEQSTPILMICHTNHALDQFLEFIIKRLNIKEGQENWYILKTPKEKTPKEKMSKKKDRETDVDEKNVERKKVERKKDRMRKMSNQ